jgi:hypothetical protein
MLREIAELIIGGIACAIVVIAWGIVRVVEWMFSVEREV